MYKTRASKVYEDNVPKVHGVTDCEFMAPSGSEGAITVCIGRPRYPWSNVRTVHRPEEPGQEGMNECLQGHTKKEVLHQNLQECLKEKIYLCLQLCV